MLRCNIVVACIGFCDNLSDGWRDNLSDFICGVIIYDDDFVMSGAQNKFYITASLSISEYK